MKLRLAVVAMATAAGMLFGACNSFSGSGSGTGGSSGGGTGGGTGGRPSSGAGGATGGSSSSGGTGGVCANVTACGGAVVGTWTVTSSCLNVSGQLDLSSFFGQGCSSAQVTGSLQVSGTWSAKSDGTYTDNTTTTGNEQLALVAACLSFSGTTITCDGVSEVLQALGYSSVSCNAAAAAGGCNCSATVNQAGGIGVVSSSASASGSFTTSGNNLTIDTNPPYAYCASGGKLTLTPQAPTAGTIVLQGGAAGTAGSGGATGGSGAVGGRGGATSVGGAAGGATGTAGAGGGTGTAGSTGAGGAPVAFQGPCDIYAAGTTPTPCVAAYSTVRLLSSKYSGPLYQVRMGGSNSGTGGTLKDIGLIAGGVFADGPSQDTFCGASACSISKLYDQSGKGNDLTVEGAGCYVKTPDHESNAKGHSVTVSGHKVYGLYTVSMDGYRNDTATGLPLGTAAQGVYEVVDGTRSNTGCCWDFGSARRDNCYTGGTGTMDTIFFGKSFWETGAGNGPWFMADFEGGVWTGGSAKTAAGQNGTDPSVTWDYAFGIVKTNTMGNTPQWAMRVGNAQSGGLTTAYDGQAPANWNLQGAVVLGTGGDNSNGSFGTFFEGAITSGRPSDATDLAIQQNAQAAGYGK
jgi:hypothetical protein